MGFAQHVYATLTWAVQPLLRRKLRRRAQQEPGYAHAVGERFGRYSPAHLGHDGRGQWVWVHAVSLGETRAAAILIQALRRQWPAMRLLLTHSTATGREAGRSLLQAGDVQVWLPWDTRHATQRFLEQFRPCMGVLMETEVWPMLLAQCQQMQVPVVLANARLNAKSLAGALRWRSLAEPAYRSLQAVWAQTESDAQRLRQLHAPVQAVLGNLKFDVEPDPAQLAIGHAWKRASPAPVVMLASSREGEESLWLDALNSLSSHYRDGMPPVQWLIVPRHPQRFDSVAAMLESAGWHVSRRSLWRDGPVSEAGAGGGRSIWLGDSVGEMMQYYALADVALMGGSFAHLGGQNLIEALACGCPVVLGPHTFNFAQASDDACAAGAAVRVVNMQEGVERAIALISDQPLHQRMQVAALDFAGAHQGAAHATASAIVEIAQSRHVVDGGCDCQN